MYRQKIPQSVLNLYRIDLYLILFITEIYIDSPVDISCKDIIVSDILMGSGFKHFVAVLYLREYTKT